MRKKLTLIASILLIIFISISLLSCKKNKEKNEIVISLNNSINNILDKPFQIYGDFDKEVSKYFALISENNNLSDEDINHETYKNIQKEILNNFKNNLYYNKESNYLNDFINLFSSKFLNSFIIADIIHGTTTDDDDVFLSVVNLRFKYYKIKKIYINNNLVINYNLYELEITNLNEIKLIIEKIKNNEIIELADYIVEHNNIKTEIDNLNIVVDQYTRNISKISKIFLLKHILSQKDDKFDIIKKLYNDKEIDLELTNKLNKNEKIEVNIKFDKLYNSTNNRITFKIIGDIYSINYYTYLNYEY